MKRIAIVYASVHHGNTKKLIEGIAKVIPVEMAERNILARRKNCFASMDSHPLEPLCVKGLIPMAHLN